MVLASGVVAAIIIAATAPAPVPQNSRLHVHACTEGRHNTPAECGSFTVFQDREAQSGKTISLRLVVLKASHPSHRAIAFIAGGPGESAVPFAGLIADGQFGKALFTLRSSYDILFVDDRGMGGSNPSKCNFAPHTHRAAYFLKLWPDDLLNSCRTALEASGTDPNFYHTEVAVDDLSDVRAALGYPKLVLDGGSYGTMFSLVYLRRHPESVESVVLSGVAPPHFMPLPGAPDGAQTALLDIEAKCRADAACAKRYPHFPQQFDALLKRLDRGPIPVKVRDARTKRFRTIALSKEVFVDRTRELLYDPEGAAFLPFIIDRADRGDTAPLAGIISLLSEGMSQDLDLAANLSYACADWVPFVSEQAVEQAAKHSFAGDLRIRAEQRACASWNVKAMPQAFNDPVRSGAPVLMIAGSDDPATPPRYGEAALAYLPNGREALVRGAGHAAELPCTDALIVEFVRAQSAKGLDVSQCSAAFIAPHFATSLAGLPLP